jgi:ClpP class serine protease
VFEDYNEEGVRQTKELLSRTHLDFINHVESHRGSKIKVPEAEKQARIYNADVFTGNEAVELGYP